MILYDTILKCFRMRDSDAGVFALLAGRSGGQTIKGDTASGGNLTLMSTAHATKGKILFGTSAYDEKNNMLGIGTTTPTYQLETTKTVKAGTAMYANTRALDFDGINDYVSWGDITEQDSATNLTLSVWINQDVIPSFDNIFYRVVDGNNDLRIYTHTTNSSISVELGNGSNSLAILNNYQNYMSAGRWHHIGAVYDGAGAANADRLKLYIDGNYVAFTTFTGTIPATTANLSSATPYFGATANSFDGRFYDFRIYSASVGASDIATIYQGGTYTTNMVHQYKLMEGSGTVATDTGSNVLNGTISGATWSTTNNNGIQIDFGRGALTLAPNTTNAKDGFWFGHENPMYRCGSNEVAADFKLALADGITAPTTSTYGLSFGGAIAGTPDAEMYRSAADMIYTPDSLTIAGDASIFGAFTITEAKDITIGTTTGTKIGTATNQKIGFYNKTPVVQPTALTAADASALNTGDATSDTVIGNMRTRIGELETKLQSTGLLA